jgi:hypothetical protein
MKSFAHAGAEFAWWDGVKAVERLGRGCRPVAHQGSSLKLRVTASLAKARGKHM